MPENVDKADILEQLERILASKDFEGSARTKSFLKHLVQRELEGRGEELRGTALAMDVFGRGAEFDPNVDPIVRIEAVKLRKSLDYYYLTSGGADPVHISIPKGQYRPHFEANFEREQEGQSPENDPGWPVLGIGVFTGSDTPRARLLREGFPEELGLELARFTHIRVLTGYGDTHFGENSEKAVPRCDYVLDGTVRDAQKSLRLIVQLKRADEGSILWSDRCDFRPDETDSFKFQEEVARNCAVKIADAYGVVATDAAERFANRAPSGQGVYQALLAFHAHLRTSRSGSLQQMIELARNATANNDSGGLAHALIALGYVEEVALGQKRLSAVRELGQTHAEKAVALEPQCQEALFAAAIYAQMAGDNSRFDRLMGAAIQANPNSALLIALAGAWLALVSDIKLGSQLVRQALEINPLLPIWTNITLCLEDVENGDYVLASEKVCKIDARENAGDWLLIAAVHGLAGEVELAQDALANFPTDQFTLDEYLADLPYATGVVDLLREGMKHLQ